MDPDGLQHYPDSSQQGGGPLRYDPDQSFLYQRAPRRHPTGWKPSDHASPLYSIGRIRGPDQAKPIRGMVAGPKHADFRQPDKLGPSGLCKLFKRDGEARPEAAVVGGVEPHLADLREPEQPGLPAGPEGVLQR